MRGPGIDYKSYLQPMIHVYKNSSGRITRQIICYRPSAHPRIGKADHKYDAEKCGWNQPLGFVYTGPLLCCVRCHRHIFSAESMNKCPQCNRSFKGAIQTVIHAPRVNGTQVPDGGVLLGRS
jgi:hypothetical protein